MQIAYADPPYMRQARKHYSHDPKCAEVDHRALISQLCEYDAWALSMSAATYSIRGIAPLMPEGSRMAAWVKPFASFKKGTNPAYTWEPVIYKTARKWSKDVDTVKDHIVEPITMKKGLVGAKPLRFCFWLFALLGATPQDEIIDLFPGTGIVTDAWEIWKKNSEQLSIF